MTRRAMLTILVLAACGGGGGGDGAPAPGGTGDPPAGGAAEKSLWPLGAGSRWAYEVDDPVKGKIQKLVEAVGEEPVPESAARAVRVRDVEQTVPPHEEWSWQQVEQDGLVSRLREEDRRDGQLVRTTTFAPGGPKALARAFPAGWKQQVVVTETTTTSTTKAVQKTYEWRVVAERESVTTPAGTFGCLRVERERVDPHPAPEPVKTYWFAPGVGKVKEVSTERTEVLVSYVVR